MKIFKVLVETAAVVPEPCWDKRETFVIAENEQDAMNCYNPMITGVMGVMHNVLSCEYFGEVSCIVIDDFKKHWNL